MKLGFNKLNSFDWAELYYIELEISIDAYKDI